MLITLITLLLSLLFIPALVLFYFCFLMSIMLLHDGGVAEGAVLKVFLVKHRKELRLIYLKFLSSGIICAAIPILWIYYS